jgi:hypothetical protein
VGFQDTSTAISAGAVTFLASIFGTFGTFVNDAFVPPEPTSPVECNIEVEILLSKILLPI